MAGARPPTRAKRLTAAGLARRISASRHLVFRLAVYVLLFSVAYVFLFPFLYMVVTSLKTARDLADYTVNWIPRSLHFENYRVAMVALRYWPYLRNSVIIAALAMLGHVAGGSFIGYGFARYEFPGRKVLFGVVVLSLIVPIQAIIIPMYMVYSNLGWLNSYLPLVLPTFLGFGLRGGLFIFIFRQFFVRLPTELEDAARIDGCSFIRTYRSIVIPLSQPAVLVSSILALVWHWHDAYEPSIYLRDPSRLPLPSLLVSLFDLLRNAGEDLQSFVEGDLALAYNDAVAMAATFLVVLPVLVVFAVVQRYFIQGVERTGLVE
jgi:multiple sugar transport system permease protein